MSLKFKVSHSIPQTIKKECSQAAHIIAQQVAKDTEPFVPAKTLSLSNRTLVDGDKVIYPGPYARYLYYGKVMVNAATGKGPSKFTDKNGNEFFYFPKGSNLKETDKDLVFSKAVHPQAQARWFEASKAQNVKKWERAAEKAVKKFV